MVLDAVVRTAVRTTQTILPQQDKQLSISNTISLQAYRQSKLNLLLTSRPHFPLCNVRTSYQTTELGILESLIL